MKKNLIAVIPARGKSKGIPKKNIVELAGKPLIAHSIEAALKSTEFARVIVSTDDKKISEISKKYGAEAIKRPKRFAKDNSPTIDAVRHAVQYLKESENYFVDSVVLLQPTSPLRNATDIKNALKIFFENGKKNVISVSEPSKSPYLAVKLEKKRIKPVFDWKYHLNTRRQDLPKTFAVNGAIYIATVKNMLKFKNFFGKNPIAYVMPKERSIDIDEMADLAIAEFLIKNRQVACH